MRCSIFRESGRADPLGLLILTVVLALSITMGIQAQVGTGSLAGEPAVACDAPCLTLDMRH
jgi:hypothetical protein